MWKRSERFTALVETYSDDLYRYAMWLTRRRTAAEDLVQETFARAWKALDQLLDERAARAWLLTTLRREHARGYARAVPELALTAFDLDELEDHHPAVDTRIEAFAVRRALAGLPAEYREPLLLQVVIGLTCDEVADVLGLATVTVRTRVFRARQRLREVLAPGGANSEPMEEQQA